MKVNKVRLMIIMFLICVLLLTTVSLTWFIRNKTGEKRPLELRSMNIGNALDAPRNQPWDVKMNSDYFKIIKKAGFNSVRLPVRFSDYAKDNPNNVLDEVFMKQVDGYIKEALSQKLTIILDLHHFQEIMKNPDKYHRCFLRIWQQLSERYKNYPSGLIFEVLNEPQENLEGNLWNKYMAEAIKIIRKSNPTRTIIVGPDNYYSLYRLNALKIPKDDHLVVSFHYYEPTTFTFQKSPYLGFQKYHDVQWNGSSDEVDTIKNKFSKVRKWADEHDVSIYLGEFGANKEAPYESRVRWTREVREQAEKYGFSWGYWEFASLFGVYDAQNNSWDKQMLRTLIPNSTDK
ncbi:endoglucanase [Sporolactobacillus nakayamae]|uniref:Endoglucanase n=1 Tax=Sporolactobacillus nakayamae TaxID=269670 RepID=A0A1I2NT90_9BACL|nr:endoglucanase [Sporolactobacillus nakayamae]